MFITAAAGNDQNMEFNQVPVSVMNGLDYLIEYSQDGSLNGYDPQAVSELIDFSKEVQDRSVLPDKRIDATPAFFQFEINGGLDQILKYGYNPKIPSVTISPCSIRLNYWKEVDGSDGLLPKLWDESEGNVTTQVVKGLEYEETTPDLTSRTYYGYDVYRTLIAQNHQKQRVFISLSKQKGKSTVGKKGLIVGGDEDWDYYYSHQKGLNKTGLGWVDAYVYDAFSAIIYVETTPGEHTRCTIYKWLRAGWSGINMVRPKHIVAGLERYANNMKLILNSPRLPSTRELSSIFSNIQKLPPSALQAKTRKTIQNLAERYRSEGKKNHKWLNQAIKGEEYIGMLSSEQMQASIYLEILKYKLGLLKFDQVAHLKKLLLQTSNRDG